MAGTTTTTTASDKPELESVNLTSIPDVSEDDSDVDLLLEELTKTSSSRRREDETKNNNDDDDDDNDNDDPLARVRKSSSRLLTSLGLFATDVDSKLGISGRAREIEERTRVAETTRGLLGNVAGAARGLDERFGLSDGARDTARRVDERARELRVRDRVGDVVADAGERWRRFDREHDLTTKTAGLVDNATGFLNERVMGGRAKKTANDTSNGGDATSFPSDFRE